MCCNQFVTDRNIAKMSILDVEKKTKKDNDYLLNFLYVG